MAVRLLALLTGSALLPRNIFLLLVLFSVKRLSEPQGLVRPEGLVKLEKNSMKKEHQLKLKADGESIPKARFNRSSGLMRIVNLALMLQCMWKITDVSLIQRTVRSKLKTETTR
jgi:hypothetical protein